MSKFHIKYVNEDAALPKKELISAVFLIAIQGSKILAIENDRGWEVPGGHIEEGEDHMQALIREVQEEAGATFSNPRLIAIVESDNQTTYKDKVMLMYTADTFELGQFTRGGDALNREVIEIDEFFRRHTGSFDFPDVIRHAQEILATRG